MAAVVAALFTAASPRHAGAQYAARGQDGHANDANNRVGSGGYNGGLRAGSAVTPNDIVNRNVTGGKEFRGPILEKDPRAFTGPAAGNINDIFTRQSNGVPNESGASQNNNGQAQPFYGESRFVAPPAGSLPEGFNGGYIGTTLNSPSSLSNGLNSAPSLTGLQSRTVNRDTFLLNTTLNSGGYNGINPATGQPFSFEAASQYGMHTFPGSGQLQLQNFATPELPDRFDANDAMTLRLRQELRDSANPNAVNPNSTVNNNQPGQPNAQQGGLNQPLDRAVPQPFDAPANAAMVNPLASSQVANAPLPSTGMLPSRTRDNSWLVPAAEQSTLLKTLQDRLADSSEVGKQLAAAHPARPQQVIKAPMAGLNQGVAAAPADAGPVQVSSLAAGVKARGLHDLLAGAEDATRQGKYDLAIQRANQVQRMAPNNPLGPLARAHAELAGGYYARAENDLRHVFRSSPELLFAQFDLASLLPKGRIDFVRKDLHDLTQSDSSSERPWLLLAYLDYNTGDTKTAESDLNEAERHGGRTDWAIRLFRQRWNLSSANKSVTPGAEKSPAPPGDTTPSVTPRPIEPAAPKSSDLNK